MSGMDVDPEALRSQAPKFGSAADAVGEVLDTLSAAIEAEGECWGTDDAGQEFAKNYSPATDQARDGLTSAVEMLNQVHRELADTATTWESSDQQGSATISAVPVEGA
ncbi:WXG100 family type VII secretion target [Saccharopolyspora sp. HNM0983]|uniref:WXG100 family type VII secretion target n=1 Tax=Saccharopolyspora montiporae TaxID=2781240 RepID=A0A929B4J2_9PSEU|nr:WXG100 family type VII secretion target [Saccharopolyspora sp. HNM0983]MBE9373049.1 WXG100 family type VII secretion target [Saccharopolyspora sp. HNM0983]